MGPNSRRYRKKITRIQQGFARDFNPLKWQSATIDDPFLMVQDQAPIDLTAPILSQSRSVPRERPQPAVPQESRPAHSDSLTVAAGRPLPQDDSIFTTDKEPQKKAKLRYTLQDATRSFARHINTVTQTND